MAIKSITITVEFDDGTTEVATIDRPREATLANRANVERDWGDRLDLRSKTAPTYDFDLAVKDAPGLEWRAYPAPAMVRPKRAPSYPLTDVQDKRGPDRDMPDLQGGNGGHV